MKKDLKNKEGVKFRGEHTFRFFRMSSPLSKDIAWEILRLTEKRDWIIRTGTATVQELERISCQYQGLKKRMLRYVSRETFVLNVTTTTGRSAIAEILTNTFVGTNAYVTHCALGDDATSPSVGQTALLNETSRKAISDSNTNGAQILLETFFGTSEAIDTHEEYSYQLDGGDANVMLNRFTEQNIKSGVESMNVQSTITLSDN